MRDLIVAAICFLGIPTALARPFLGFLFFTWLAYMRPQDLSWGFAKETQWSKYVAICMILGILFHSKEKFFRLSYTSILIVLLFFCLTVSVYFSVDYEASILKYHEYAKIMLVAVIGIGLLKSKERIHWFFVTLACSLGFHGIKNALTGALRGGKIGHGPGGAIEDNNDFALALVMTVPTLYYLGKMEKRPWLRYGYWGACCGCIITILWTHSRGGLLGVCAVLFLISMSWRNKLWSILFWAIAPVLFFAVAPQSLLDRYSTLKEYEKEGSAVSRLHSWQTAFNIGLAHPFTGAGPKTMVQIYWEYAPPVQTSLRPEAHVAHNAYMQIFADSGIISFTTFITLLFFTIGRMFLLRRRAFKRKEIAWCIPYTYMIQFGLSGYMVSTIFLSQEYFDLVYQLAGTSEAIHILTSRELRQAKEAEEKELKEKALSRQKKPMASSPLAPEQGSESI